MYANCKKTNVTNIDTTILKSIAIDTWSQVLFDVCHVLAIANATVLEQFLEWFVATWQVVCHKHINPT